MTDKNTLYSSQSSKKRKLPGWLDKTKTNTETVTNNDPCKILQQEFLPCSTSKDETKLDRIKKDKKTRQLPACFLKGTLSDTSLPLLTFPGKIDYCYHRDECNFILEDLRKNSESIVCGFDIEWKVFSKNKTPLVQLCPSDDRCYLFHLSCMTGFPSELKCLLESEEILKVGVGVSGDMSRLCSDYGIVAKGVVDLSPLANRITKANENWSLTGLIMNLFKKKLDKDPKIRCGNWELFPLSDKQLEYAAIDAYAGFIVYKKLISIDSSNKTWTKDL